VLSMISYARYLLSYSGESRRLLGYISLSVAIHLAAILGTMSLRFALIEARGRAPERIFANLRGGNSAEPLLAVTERRAQLPLVLDELNQRHQLPSVVDDAVAGAAEMSVAPRLLFVRELDLERLPDSDGGYVEVELLVAPNGVVLKVDLISTNLPNAYFAEIEDAFLTSSFSPRVRGQKPEFSRVRFRTFFGAPQAGEPIANRQLGTGLP
jgi:hypothetical protein